MYLVRACGLLTPSTVPGIGLGGLLPQPDSAVLGGLLLASTTFRDIRVHGPSMRIDALSAPAGIFVSRVFAVVGTGDNRLGRAPFWPTANAFFHSRFRGALRGYSTNITPKVPFAPIGGFSGIAAYGPHLYSDAPKNRRCCRCRALCR